MSNTKAARRRDLVLEEVRWLAGTDHPDNIARRLGHSSVRRLADQVKCWGRPDLADRLRRGCQRLDGRSAA